MKCRSVIRIFLQYLAVYGSGLSMAPRLMQGESSVQGPLVSRFRHPEFCAVRSVVIATGRRATTQRHRFIAVNPSLERPVWLVLMSASGHQRTPMELVRFLQTQIRR